MLKATRRCAVYAIRAWIVAVWLLSAAPNAFPQTALAAVIGSVRDGQGRPVPDAMVKVEQQETMLTRETRSTSAGVYAIRALPIGTYSVFISHAGFATAESRSVRLLVGQTRTVNGNLQIAPRNEQMVVAASVSEIEQTSATIGGRMGQTQIEHLPINGRNWATLLPLIPGAVDPGTSDQRSVRFAGHGRDDNNFSFDGVDAGGISNQPQKAAIRLAIPTSTISAFKVDSTLYTADSADGTGAQIILASKGGTNAFHGDGFDFLRNDAFDARNPFSQRTPPFRLNQFGANLGGPVVRNKTFFFVAFEGLRQRLDQTLQGFVPSASYRAQVASRSPALAFLINSYPTMGTIRQANNSSIDLFNGLSPQIDNENSGMVRIDHRFSNAVTSFLRVNVDEAVTDVPLSNLRDRQVADYRPINGILNITQVLSPTLLNETKFGFNQVFSRTSSIGLLPYTVAVSGFTSLPGSSTREEDDTSASIQDDISFTHGRHTVKAGVRVRRVLTNPGSSASGTLSYVNRNTLLANQLDRATVTDALPLKRLRKTQAYGFIQDEYKATAGLTFNLGLRYQFFNVFHETDGRAVPFDFASCGGFCQPGAEFSDPRKNDLDPRVAVAWAPASLNNKTVFRAGFGIYHGDGQLEDQNLPSSNDVLRYSLNSRDVRNLSYPIIPFLATTPGTLSPRAQNRNRKDEYSAQWGFSVQQELAQRLTATVSYFGNKGTDLQTITAANVANPLTGLRPYPQFGQVEYRTNDSNSTFHALQISVQQNFHSGLVFGTNYMWSHAINDGSLGGGETDAIQPQNVFCRACERADSAQDIRHFFTANAVYNLPFGAGKRYLSQPGLWRAIAGDWSLSGIGTARSGRPVNVTISRSASFVPGGYNVNQRPDRVPGVSLTPPGGSTAGQWINPAAFAAPAPGTFGNAGRDIARGPNLYQLDLGLEKQIPVTERLAVQFRTEVFNIFNRAQYGDPLSDLTVPAQFGLIQSTINRTPVGTGTPRQIQFMLRLSF